MDDSFDMFDSSDECINLESIQYKPPVEKTNKKDVKNMEKQNKLIDKQLSKKKPKKEVMTEEEVVAKRKMIILISYYLLEFIEKLKAFKK